MSMMPKDIDERARRTRSRIARALVALAMQRPLESITVRELVREAGISRSTFYAHYTSLEDYLTRSYAWMLERGTQLSAAQPGGDRHVLPVRAILDHMSGKAAYVAATLGSAYRPAMLAAGEDRLRAVAGANLRRLRPALAPADRQAMANFLAGGFMGMLKHWSATELREAPGSVQARFESFCAAIVGPLEPVAA